MPASRLSKIAGSSSILLNQALNSLSNFAITFYLLQAIGVTAFGIYAAYSILSLNLVAALIGLIVLPAMSISFQMGPTERNDLRGATTILIAGAGMAIVTLGLVAAIGHAWAPLPLDGLLLAGLSVSLLIVEYLRRTFILYSSHALLWVTDLTRYGLLAVAFAIIALNHLELAPQTYVLTFAACNAVAAVIASLARLFQSRGRIDWSRSLRYFPRLLGGGKWLSLSAIMSFVVDNLLVLIASATLGPFAIGIVRACQTIVGLLNPVFTALENMVPKWLGGQIYESGMETALRKYARLAGMIYVAGAAALLVIAVLADPVLAAFAGPDSAGYGWILQVLCLATSAVLGSLLTAFIFRAWEQTRPIFFSYLTACTSTFVVGVPLMLSLGMLGVVLGMLLAPIINFLALQSLLWMELRKRSQRSVARGGGAAEHA